MRLTTTLDQGTYTLHGIELGNSALTLFVGDGTIDLDDLTDEDVIAAATVFGSGTVNDALKRGKTPFGTVSIGPGPGIAFGPLHIDVRDRAAATCALLTNMPFSRLRELHDLHRAREAYGRLRSRQ